MCRSPAGATTIGAAARRRRRGAAATLRIEAAGADLFILSLHARSRRGLRPVPARVSREGVVEAVDGFLRDCREREAAPAMRSRYDPRGGDG